MYKRQDQFNPIRYRGYYYDTEAGFYYLQSRYYDPIIRRFLNADGSVGANQDAICYNLFAYCSNNPIMLTDESGTVSYTHLDVYKRQVLSSPRIGSALKVDPYHAFNDIIDNYAGYASKFSISNGTCLLYTSL